MPRVHISLTDRADMTHVPLAALGYTLGRVGLLEPLNQVPLPIKTMAHSPGDKLIEALVLILAGGRATAQADLLLRPNRGLAHAWGQAQFAQPSTLADALDAFQDDSVEALRTAFETILHCRSRALAHDFRTGPLFLDEDLSGLPASPQAEGSTKGYFAGEKTKPVVRSHGSVPRRIMKHSGRCCTQAFATAFPRSSRASPWPNAYSP